MMPDDDAVQSSGQRSGQGSGDEAVDDAQERPERFLIVGVGASAGGIEALEGFFRGMPSMPGLGIVIVTHLSPWRESVLHEIVSRFTDMPVEVASDGVAVAENHVYVLPADAVVGIRDGLLVLRHQSAEHRERHPVDIFLSALAADQGEYAGGAILSGGDSDGTLGIKAIKEHGGVTLAQIANGDGPQHPSMPSSAIATGYVDFGVPSHEMGAKLVAYRASLSMTDTILAGNEAGPSPDELRGEIYAILRAQVGHDFGGYKTKTFLRRVQRRMQILQVEVVATYVERLRRDPVEVSALFRDLLINVTTFFRDAEAFAMLSERVIPKLFEGRGADQTVRVWVPGCATGEEVFSLAILMIEHMETLTAACRVQIFATDIDEHALGVARAGRYPEQLLDGVSPERRRRFFLQDGASFVLAKTVRDLCIFSPHSVIRDPPFSRLDMVSCRNLLIYFGLSIQNQVLPTFHYALRPGGFLFLGMSENLSQFADLFAPIDKKHRIFRSRADNATEPRVPLALSGLRAMSHGRDLRPRQGGNSSLALRHSVEMQVLERFTPPHVAVNRQGDVVYYSNRTGKYLEAAAGLPTRQLLTMARKGLRLELRAAFRESVDTNAQVVREGLVVEGDDGRVQIVTVTIEPLVAQRSEEPLFLVLFSDEGPSISREAAQKRSVSAHDEVALQLERELRETRERLQSLIEEYETALEELKSSNEELVSVNEELQSTNEELEASKEELQSVNEELYTVNAELNGKVEALDRANTDLHNLFASTDIATVFLDAKLVIRSYTPAVTEIFNILPSDRGRPITDFAGRLTLPNLAEDVAAIMQGSDTIERQIDRTKDSARFLVRLAPYRNGENRIEGVVVSFMDVTVLARAEMSQRVLVAELQHRTRNLLAVVQSIARQTLGTGSAVEAYSERLKALGRVQGLFGRSDSGAVDLAELVRLELRAHGTEEGSRITIDGPEVALGFEHVQTFALALHELATNAIKHGALAQAGARLAIAWSLEANPASGRLLVLDWTESGVAMPPEPERRGFGRDLIEKALSYSLRAQAWFELGADGVHCRIEMPL
ncbi:CheR family methyltransferase [Methylobacterium sp. WL103]|uniref:CheR family methyltransferase n=1 Tax=Methylobacterium sp. WL103 TaxID=2603891 RepID=UPI001FEE7C28|nr:CheR family methyltransferase [Methylobacterium sp. WL103]